MPLDLELQTTWDPDPLRRAWPQSRDGRAFFERIAQLPRELTAPGASGPVLEVAAAEGLHACRLAEEGLDCVIVEPATELLARAREHAARRGVRLHLVRGIAEALPFPDATFDRVLCDSALDHFAAPDQGLREMARGLAPTGRMVVSFVNYASLSTRVSRLWYRLDRARLPESAARLRFWDSPVPHEHAFESTYRNILALCGQYLELERVVGVSLLHGVPGWGAFLDRLPAGMADRVTRNLHRAARRVPGLADMVFTVWRPRQPADQPGIGLAMLPRSARLGAPRPAAPHPGIETMRCGPADPLHRAHMAETLTRTVALSTHPGMLERAAATRPMENAALTGDPARSWLDDLIDRGPFRHAALLGASPWAATWLQRGASERLDVLEASPLRLDLLRRRLAPWLHRVRLWRADPDFVTLPRGAYDLVWTDAGLADVVNLEYLLDEIARALRPGGLFCIHEYVGEPRHCYAPARLARINAALRDVPDRFRRDGVESIAPPSPSQLGPLHAARSDEILPLARARFEVVHEARTGALFPLLLHLDIPALAREAPDVLARLDALEAEARRDAEATCATTYTILRARPACVAPRPGAR
jgi:ubiquinone/menaquinone biosynthesis C-methylase UbiE